MPNCLSRREAVQFLGLGDKTFDNYFKNAKEFCCLERVNNRGRYYFDRVELDNWLNDYKWRTIDLNIDDYLLCLDFALAMHFIGYVTSDFGTPRKREFGQKVANWIKGQLAELAVKKFFKREFEVDIGLDFNIHGKIVPQDIISIDNRDPQIGVGIKASKPKSAFLILTENEVLREDRRSDVYIFCRPDIPDDHLLRLSKNGIVEQIRNQPHFNSYSDCIPDFTNIKCEIAGFCEIDELIRVDSIPGQDFDGFRYVKETGYLHKSMAKWRNLISRL